MAKITYIVGRTVDGRQTALESAMAACEGARFLHLVPTRGRVMDLEAESRFWPRRRVETLTRVIRRIFEEDVHPRSFAECRFADRGLRALLVRKALERRGGQPEGLAYFSRLLESRRGREIPAGLCRRIEAFFALLSRNNMLEPYVEEVAGRVVRLEEAAPGTGEARYALEADLTWLLGDYEEIKREARVYDEGDITSAVRACLEQGLAPRLMADTDAMVLDGFVFLSRVEEDILFHLFCQAGDVYWLLDADPAGADPIEAFRSAAGREARWHRFDRARRRPGETGDCEAGRALTSLVSLVDRLEEAGAVTELQLAAEGPFGNPVAGGFYTHGRPEALKGGNLRVRPFPDRVVEVRALAAEIKRLVCEEGLDPACDLGRIRLIFPRLKDYASLVSEIFPAWGIPYSLTQGVPLSFHPLARLFLEILELPLNGFEREDIRRFFSAGRVCSDRNEGGSPWEPDRQGLPAGAQAFTEEGLRELRERLTRRIPDPPPEPDLDLFDAAARRAGVQRLGRGLGALWDRQVPRVRDFYHDRWRHAVDRKEARAVLGEYLGFVTQALLLERRLRPFAELSAQGSPQGIVDGLLRILDLLGFPQELVRIPSGLAGLPAAALRSLLRRDVKACQAAQDRVRRAAREMDLERELFGGVTGEALLARFQAVLRAGIEETYLLDERDPNVVRVSEWLEIRGRAFDYVLAGGLTADVFPLKEPEDFILPEVPHRMFRRRDPVLLSKHLFSHLLRNTRRRLFLSWPRYAGERETLPSPVLVDLAAMVDARPAPGSGAEVLEEIFAWPDNPYATSPEEWLTRPLRRAEADPGREQEPFAAGELVCPSTALEEKLIRGINALRSRRASDGLFEYDGVVRDAEAFEAFAEAGQESFSPSQLETLANCPMHYLFRHIYGLRPREELAEDVSPRDMGVHVHAILKAIFERLVRDGRNVQELGLDRAFALARETAEAYFARHPSLEHLGFFAFQKRALLAGLEPEAAGRIGADRPREGLLAQLLRFEAAACGGARPRGLEFAFGHGCGPAVPLGGVRLKGIVDRFDVDSRDPDTAYIYDYKTGALPAARMCRMGLSFQLPVYVRALKAAQGFKRVTAVFYALKRQALTDGNPFKQRVNDGLQKARGLDIGGVMLFEGFVRDLVGLMRQGVFHHSVDEMHCAFCDFAWACFRDRRRMEGLLESGAKTPIYSGARNLAQWDRVADFRKRWRETEKSMSQALGLKTRAGRRRHYEKVRAFRAWLEAERDGLPLEPAYLDACLGDLEAFEKEYVALAAES